MMGEDQWLSEICTCGPKAEGGNWETREMWKCCICMGSKDPKSFNFSSNGNGTSFKYAIPYSQKLMQLKYTHYKTKREKIPKLQNSVPNYSLTCYSGGEGLPLWLRW